MLLFLVQIGAGVVNLVLLAPVWLQLVHLLLADLVWLSLVLLTAAALADRRRSDAAGEVLQHAPRAGGGLRQAIG